MKIVPYPLRSLSKIVCILFLIGLISGGVMDRSLAQKIEPTPAGGTNRELQEDQNIQLAQVVFFPSARIDNTEREYSGTVQKSSFIFALRKTPLILIGGIFLLIGTFFVPGLFPQLIGHHGKMSRFFENTVRTYKTILHHPHQRSVPCPVVTGTYTPPLTKTQKHRTLSEDKHTARAYYTLRCDNIVSTASQGRIPKSSPLGMLRTFFQQSGFRCTKTSETELKVQAPLSPYSCYGEIPVYVIMNTVLNRELVQQIYHKATSQHSDKPSDSGKIVFVIVTIPPEDSAYHQIYTYKVKQHCTIIPLRYLLVTKSVRYASCAYEMERIIRITTGQSNLYAMNIPVADPLSCFGRTEVLNQLLDTVNQHQQIRLFGPRKIGKTWLLWQLKEQLSEHITAYVNLQQFAGDCASLYRQLLDDCKCEVTFKYPEIHLPESQLTRAEPSERDREAFVHDMVSLWKRVRAKQPNLKVIFLLDEAEQLLAPDPDRQRSCPDFHELREVIQNISQEYGFLVTLMASTTPEIDQKEASALQPQVECQHYQEVFLTSLAEDGCNQLITTIGAQMGLTYTEEALSRLYYETGGHPYVTRQVCSLIAKNLKHPHVGRQTLTVTDQTIVQVRDVEQAIAEYLEYKSEHLERIWQQLSQTEQEVLLTVISKDSCTLEDLMTHERDQQKKNARQQALSRLIEHDLLEKCENKFSITMGLLDRLILTNC